MDYVYLRAWCKLMRSAPEYTTEQVARARATNAPATAIHEVFDTDGPTGVWKTYEEILNPSTKLTICGIVAVERLGQ